MKHPPSKWTPKTIATLSRMAREGANAAQIAAALGNGLTRNAVLGKIHRMRANGKALPMGAAHAPLKPKAKPMPKPKPAPVALTPRPVALSFYDTVDPKTPGLLRMMDLQPNDCRWPLKAALQGEYYFCGAQVAPDRPYCPAHVALAYDNRNKRQGAA